MAGEETKMQADVVIIGGGGAGLPAALTAHERGCSVLVLEKRRAVGGNAMMAEGFFAAESPAQRRLLIDANRDHLYKVALDYAHYKIDTRVLRAFINKSGDTVRWIEEKGMKFNRIAPFYPNQVPLVWHIVEGHGATLIKIFERECKERGIPILRKTRAKRILTDGEGKIVGVRAQGEKGHIDIGAGSVIIATGGFASNRKLLKKYCPQYMDILERSGVPGMDGDGLMMAMELGASTEGLGNIMLVGPAPFPKNWTVEGVAGEPCCIWVNGKGERFIHETITFNVFEAANAILRQKGGICYSILDSGIKNDIAERGLVRGCGEMFVPRGQRLDDLDEELRKQTRKGGAMASESLEEISEWIGASRGALRKTVEEYNSFCERRYDETFLKDPQYLRPLRTPPYYAIRSSGALLGTTGGIKINHRMEVLDEDHDPIPGLYAAGSDAGGWESDTYCAVLSGSAFGFALNSGRIAAESAAAYVRSKGTERKRV
ncbi:MAG: FAD-dependent oxidoreductase [Deltaproteobacteria bacterium]|nr:FAD-dependent oxidoreductase [Deltaproteobacteria bacterium]